ncbi:MAG: sensor histidine kinase [Nitrospirota bacterium]
MKGYLFIIGTLIIVISGLITLNIFFQQSLQMEIAEQFNRQQLLLSRSIADNIRSHINHEKGELLLLSHIISGMDIRNKRDIEALKNKIRESYHELTTANLGLISAQGEILFHQGDDAVITPLIPEMLQRAKTLGPNSTYLIETTSVLYVIAPVVRQGKSGHILFLWTKIDDMARNFVSSIKSGSRGYAWMMDKDGNLLYHPSQPGMVGRNLYKADATCFKCHMSFDLEKKIIEGKTDSYGRYIAPSGEDKIIAFSTAQIDNLSWVIAISSPYSEVTHATRRSMEIYSYLIISIFLTTSIVATMLIVMNKKRITAQSVARRKEELEHYAVELEERVNERTAELASEKEKLNTIVSAIGSGIVLINKEGRIQWANQMIKEMAGTDLVGKTCEEVCRDCSFSEPYGGDGTETVIVSNLFGLKDNYFQITTAPVKGEDGEVHGYIRLIQDITEIKKMEEQIIHSEKLASIGRLAAGIAHEIGNPLTSIFSFAQILREMEEDPFKKESLETIYFHINRISDILKQLSGFSKMPAGEARQCNINEVIETSINLIQYDKKAKNTVIVRDLSPSLPEAILDCNQLSQVFVNLTLNAMDAMPGGGTLTVRSMTREGNIIIQFEDTGTGIPKEDLNKIFDPFYTTKEKGTGLGLAVSYNIVKKMNGTLTVESEPGKGTTFTITIPSSPEKTKP